jgi:hypothetical protein
MRCALKEILDDYGKAFEERRPMAQVSKWTGVKQNRIENLAANRIQRHESNELGRQISSLVRQQGINLAHSTSP